MAKNGTNGNGAVAPGLSIGEVSLLDIELSDSRIVFTVGFSGTEDPYSYVDDFTEAVEKFCHQVSGRFGPLTIELKAMDFANAEVEDQDEAEEGGQECYVAVPLLDLPF